MKTFLKRASLFLALLLSVFAAGWLVGNSGRAGVRRALDATRLRLMLTAARGDVLHSRVSLYNMNFGDASRALEEAKAQLANARLQLAGRVDATKRLDEALSEIAAAQAQAGKLDPSAHASAARAGQGIDDTLSTLPVLPPAD